MPRVVDPYSSFRSCSDGIGRFQFVHDLKIASHYGELENISRLTGGVPLVVAPCGPYRWNRTFSIRARSENCILLGGLGKYFTSYQRQGEQGLSIRTVRTDGIERFQSVHDLKIASY